MKSDGILNIEVTHEKSCLLIVYLAICPYFICTNKFSIDIDYVSKFVMLMFP